MAGGLLFLLSACASPITSASTSSAPSPGVDLGGSSRIPRSAAVAGEGEGYGAVQASPTAHASM